MVFVNEGGGQRTEPSVIAKGRTGPDGTGMVTVRRFVAALARCCHWDICQGQVQAALSGDDVLRCPEELRGFQYHLDDVSVAVALGRCSWVRRQKEDVHDVT